MKTSCSATTPPRTIACGAPAEEVIAGCIHEHVGPRDLCYSHVDDLRNGEMFCGDCLEVGVKTYLHIIRPPVGAQVTP